MLIKDNDPHVIVAEPPPTQPNPRMAAQQGLLLSNRSEERTFSECLLGMILKSPVAVERQIVSKLVLKRNRRIEILETLEKMGTFRTSMLPPNPKAIDDAKSITDRLRERLADERNKFGSL